MSRHAEIKAITALQTALELMNAGHDIRQIDLRGVRPVVWVAPTAACDALKSVPYRITHQGGAPRKVLAAPFPPEKPKVQVRWEELH